MPFRESRGRSYEASSRGSGVVLPDGSRLRRRRNRFLSTGSRPGAKSYPGCLVAPRLRHNEVRRNPAVSCHGARRHVRKRSDVDDVWMLRECDLCGQIVDSSQENAFYTAPASPSLPEPQVTITATSVADKTKSVSATVTFVAGTMGFSTSTNFPAGNAPVGVVAADFNGDGKADLAVADSGSVSSGDPGGVSILLGNGDGTFSSAVSFPRERIRLRLQWAISTTTAS